MIKLDPKTQSAVQVHIAAIHELTGAKVSSFTYSGSDDEHLRDLQELIWDRHGYGSYDSKVYAVVPRASAEMAATPAVSPRVDPTAVDLLRQAASTFRYYEREHRDKLPQTPQTLLKAMANKGMAEVIERFLEPLDQDAAKRASLPEDALKPSFEPVEPDWNALLTVPELARALRTWDEESADKGWAQSTDEDRHEQSARYLLGIVREQQRWTGTDAAMPSGVDDPVGRAARAANDAFATARFTSVGGLSVTDVQLHTTDGLSLGTCRSAIGGLIDEVAEIAVERKLSTSVNFTIYLDGSDKPAVEPDATDG